VIELGKAGSGGAAKGVLPVLRDGSVVATLRASSWKEAATAVIGDREWVFAKTKGELTARWAAEPEGSSRFRARQQSFWRGTWLVDLAGSTVEVVSASFWKGTHRYLSGGRQVGESGNTGGWSARATVRADPAMPLDQQVFLLWLEVVISRRNNAATTAGVSAAVIGGSG
jgi:hypothetical protein